MDNLKREFATELNQIVIRVIEEMFISQGTRYETSGQYVAAALNITLSNLQELTGFISEFLPRSIYLDDNRAVKDYIAETIAHDLILFLVQEDVNSKEFANNAQNFKDEIISVIANDIYVMDSNHSV